MLNRTLPQSRYRHRRSIAAQDSRARSHALRCTAQRGKWRLEELNVRSVCAQLNSIPRRDVVMERSGAVLNQALLPSAYFSLDITAMARAE